VGVVEKSEKKKSELVVEKSEIKTDEAGFDSIYLSDWIFV
jgi:hypothetical protein